MSTFGWLKQKWFAFFLILTGSLLVAFVVWMIYDSSRRNTAADRRNVADLAILTDGLEQWPKAIAALGASNVYRVPGAAAPKPGDGVSKILYHPAFHEYRIRYFSPGPCGGRSIRAAAEAGGPAQLDISGEVRPASETAPLLEGLDRKAGPICYSVSLPLEPMLRVREVAPRFSQLLIVKGPGGEIVAQLGGDPLPLKNVDNLPPLKHALIAALQRSVPKSAAAADSGVRGALEPIDTEIAGARYRLYQRPFSLGGDTPGYMAIGVVPYDRVQASSMRVSRDTVTAFALAFALLLALLPIIKLRLLGPVDDLTQLETGAVVLGLCVAAWVATMAVGYSLLIVHGRAVAEGRARSTASLMAKDIGDEIARLFARGDGRDGLRGTIALLYRPAAQSGPAPPQTEERSVLSLKVADCHTAACLSGIPQPDTVLLADASGGQADGTPVATFRADAGAYSQVGERAYFQHALHREFPSGSGRSRFPLACVEEQFAMEQVRSLPDGIARTLFGMPVDEREDCVATGGRGRPAVVIAAVVLRSLVSPLLRRDVEFMVVDREDPRLRTLFHSVEPRALVESLDDHSNGPELRAALGRLPLDDDRLTSFAADYDGERHIFAAASIRHTSWAVLTHVDRRRIDERSADVALGALWLAVALAALAGLVLLCCWLYARHRLWMWLWPDAHYVHGYRALRMPLAALSGISALILTIAWLLPGWHFPRLIYIVIVVIIPVLAAAWLWAQLGRSATAGRVRSALRVPEPARCQDRRLTAEAERSYLIAVAGMLLLLMVFPAVAQLYDAGAYVSQAEGQSESNWLRLRADERDRRLFGIARIYDPKLRQATPPRVTCDRKGPGTYVLKEHLSQVSTMLGTQRRIAFRRNEPQASELPCGREGGEGAAGRHLAAYLLIVLLAFFLCVMVWKSVRSTLRGLFGFGIALEAVEQPGLGSDWDWTKAPQQTLVVGAPVEVQATIREDHKPDSAVNVIDLVTETDAESPGTAIEKIRRGERVVIENLELLLRDPLRRYRALRFLELLVAKQRRQTSIKVVVLTDLSPLERLLQRFERDSEVLESAKTPEARKQLDDIKRNREDVRWSRLFASFATFSHRRMTDAFCGDSMVERVMEDRRAKDPLTMEQRLKVARRVLEELAPLPAHVVRCGLPYKAKSVDALRERVALELNAVSGRAVVDHFASVFIEHYQLIWSASSLAERLIMYHLAHGRVVSIERAYAVRTLVRRGVVVLDPVPRLFNRSFAQFVRNVEKPETLSRWRRDAPSGAWAKAQLPMLILVPVGLATLLFLVKQSGQSAFALAPILVTAAPALLQALGVLRRPGTV